MKEFILKLLFPGYYEYQEKMKRHQEKMQRQMNHIYNLIKTTEKCIEDMKEVNKNER